MTDGKISALFYGADMEKAEIHGDELEDLYADEPFVMKGRRSPPNPTKIRDHEIQTTAPTAHDSVQRSAEPPGLAETIYRRRKRGGRLRAPHPHSRKGD